MNYEERLKKIVGNVDPFWVYILNEFVDEVYENKEDGIDALEKLNDNEELFNEFTRQIVQKRNEWKVLKKEFLECNKANTINHIVITFTDMVGGKLSKGVVLNDVYDFVLNGLVGIGHYSEKFCGTNGEVNLDVKMPFVMKESDISSLNDIVKTIKNDEKYIYNEQHHLVPSSKVRKHAKISINGKNYEALYDDKLFNELLHAIYFNSVSKVLNASYNEYMQ